MKCCFVTKSASCNKIAVGTWQFFSTFWAEMFCIQVVLWSQQLHSCALEKGITKTTGIMEEIRLGTDYQNYYSINLIHSKPNTKKSSNNTYILYSKQRNNTANLKLWFVRGSSLLLSSLSSSSSPPSSLSFKATVHYQIFICF